ncbi:MAG: NFACT family protein [Calditrichaeota bacterium]|nr:NFACT family protein [Calditrichota bacterium]
MIKKLVKHLDQKIRQAEIKQIFTEIKNELVFETDHGFLQIGLHRDLPFIIYRDEYARKSQSMTILTDLQGEQIKSIRLVNNKRVIKIETERFDLVLNLYHGAAGFGVYDHHKTLLHNVKNDPSDLYFEEDLHDKHFHQLLTDEMKYRAITKDELASLLEASDRLFFYSTGKSDHLSLIELKHLQAEAETSSSQDFLSSYRYFLFKLINRNRFETAQKEIEQAIFSQMKKNRSTLKTLERLKLSESEKKQFEEYGHLIMANLQQIETGASELETTNLFAKRDETVKIPLKTDLKPQENAQYYYRKAKQFEENKQTVQVRIDAAQKKLARLEEYQDKFKSARQLKDLQKLRNELIRSGYLAVERSKEKRLIEKPLNSAMHFSIDSHDVYIGKSAENNDYLSMKFARANDYWFHVPGSPG